MSDVARTIYALSSGALPSGVAVIRLSGPDVSDVLATMVQGDVPPRHASFKTIRTRNAEALDRGLVLLFPGPNSFTGEDVLEFHLHGGRAVVEAVYRELGTFETLRQATAGEFTRRAFENGKLDLIEIEGLADLIGSETEMQRRLAVEHSSGGLSAVYQGWSTRLTYGRALIEAELDFADEDDVPGSVSEQIWADIAKLRTEIESHFAQASAGEIIRDGFNVVIAGLPNAGKSSLMNALVRREVAIVTNVAGTTRDLLTVDLDIGGYLVRLHDTAGLRDTDEIVEREGIRRARIAIDNADLVLYVEDTSLAASDRLLPAGALLIGTKGDLPLRSGAKYELIVSISDTLQLDSLKELIGTRLKSKVQPQSMAIPSRARHKDSLVKCFHALGRAVDADGQDLDLRAEELRIAGDALGRITGKVDVENLLDVIFGEFCIGK